MGDHTWVTDTRGALSWHGLMEYMELWDAISEFHLNISEDLHQWKFESSGLFSSRSAYRAFFVGTIQFETRKRLWKAWAPKNARPSFGLLFITAVGQQLIACKKRGLQHPDHCPLRPRR
ncbi:hypothetical protein PVAP13_3NG158708 [Panicum virgatum]|uniref:Uncharacterized protein n=1 Tax=Panicum virgatum TaxID=38727 RepID=A0A8T0UBW3_PANVG|nr:hypothetical protein PVAP13_3NG158708 [Panicum virgatum]